MAKVVTYPNVSAFLQVTSNFWPVANPTFAFCKASRIGIWLKAKNKLNVSGLKK
jgi:hypothetical protein